jgi:hypothetical protein
VADVRISLCGLALLGIIVDLAPGKGASQEALYAEVRPHTRRDEFPGQLDAWPHDIGEWVDELQTLLDHGLVVREAGEESFIYRPTRLGDLYLRAAIHPRGNTWESVA